jgi:uncharacterized protein with HEPN domain
MKPEDMAYLRHILDAIIHIEDFSQGITSASSLKDRPLERAGIERMLTIIGEAAKNLSHNYERNSRISPGRRPQGCGIKSCTIISV